MRAGPAALAALVAFALLCSAVAYLIYYRLMSELGPTKALTVTFLIPVFGMLWGSMILAERISLAMIGGAALVLAGTGLVALKGGPKALLRGDRASPRFNSGPSN